MKAKKTIVVLAVLLVAALFFVSTSHASQWYYNMNVVSIGLTDAGYLLKVEKGTTIVQKYLNNTDAKTMLAVVLTAQSQGSPIHVYLDTGFNEITGVILTSP